MSGKNQGKVREFVLDDKWQPCTVLSIVGVQCCDYDNTMSYYKLGGFLFMASIDEV